MIFTEEVEYKLNEGKQNLPGFDAKYLNIVDYILKITEEIWEQRAVWVIYDTYGTDIPIHSGAGTVCGVEEVVRGTLKTLSSFPDRKMGGEAVIWSTIGDNHFYSSHRIGSTATNLGDTVFGKATGKKVFFRTIADCLVTENRIIEEWLVRDNLHLIQQLGFDVVEMAKRDKRYNGQQPNFSRNGAVQKEVNLSPITIQNEAADLIVALFEKQWKQRNFDDLNDYYTRFALVHAICENDLRGTRLVKKYLEHLFASFPDAEVHLERITCNEKTDETEVAARWKIIGNHTGEGFFGAPSGKHIVVMGISHFIVKGGKITEEWLVFDGFDVLCQIHAA
jgi:predicted ester cyclase